MRRFFVNRTNWDKPVKLGAAMVFSSRIATRGRKPPEHLCYKHHIAASHSECSTSAETTSHVHIQHAIIYYYWAAQCNAAHSIGFNSAYIRRLHLFNVFFFFKTSLPLVLGRRSASRVHRVLSCPVTSCPTPPGSSVLRARGGMTFVAPIFGPPH